MTWGQIRSMLRMAILAGDVVSRQQGLEGAHGGYSNGLDSVRRCMWWDALKAIGDLPPDMRLAISQDIGEVCEVEHKETKPARTPEEAKRLFTQYILGNGLHFHVRLTVAREILDEAKKIVVERCSDVALKGLRA